MYVDLEYIYLYLCAGKASFIFLNYFRDKYNIILLKQHINMFNRGHPHGEK